MVTIEELRTPLVGTPREVVTADGARLYTLSAGEGWPVVFAHGYGADHESWTVIARRLVAKGRKVVVFDQRGHGRSTLGSQGVSPAAMAGDYQAVLEQHQVERGVLVGHSMGGFLALKFMLGYPEVVARRLSHAVILASMAGRVLEKNFQNRFQVPLIRSGLMARLLHFERFARAFCRSLAADAYEDALMERFIPKFRGANHRALWPVFRALRDEDLYPRLSELKLPCTIVVGAEDRTTPAFHGERMASTIAGARLIRIEGAKHCLNLEAADPLVERIVAVSA